MDLKKASGSHHKILEIVGLNRFSLLQAKRFVETPLYNTLTTKVENICIGNTSFFFKIIILIEIIVKPLFLQWFVFFCIPIAITEAKQNGGRRKFHYDSKLSLKDTFNNYVIMISLLYQVFKCHSRYEWSIN